MCWLNSGIGLCPKAYRLYICLLLCILLHPTEPRWDVALQSKATGNGQAQWCLATMSLPGDTNSTKQEIAMGWGWGHRHQPGRRCWRYKQGIKRDGKRQQSNERRKRQRSRRRKIQPLFVKVQKMSLHVKVQIWDKWSQCINHFCLLYLPPFSCVTLVKRCWNKPLHWTANSSHTSNFLACPIQTQCIVELLSAPWREGRKRRLHIIDSI